MASAKLCQKHEIIYLYVLFSTLTIFLYSFFSDTPSFDSISMRYSAWRVHWHGLNQSLFSLFILFFHLENQTISWWIHRTSLERYCLISWFVGFTVLCDGRSGFILIQSSLLRTVDIRFQGHMLFWTFKWRIFWDLRLQRAL